MKKLIISLFIASSIGSSFANDIGRYAGPTTAASPIVITTFNPVAGVISASSIAFSIFYAMGAVHYEGLNSDAIEVLAGSIELEDSAALSMFKEDILSNKVAVESELQANDIDLAVEELTDEEIAQLAIASSVHQ
ncbi:MAG: hypothetical protein CME64_13410 [Halobacteriovoraceae bacterium]|nr:hypothetical protein [Halobacteriovoraceae bacterium]|tara:strand:- start:10951 stop:11355 length:405 start_codon:yes stop_codon:yes gene_type:complete